MVTLPQMKQYRINMIILSIVIQTAIIIPGLPGLARLSNVYNVAGHNARVSVRIVLASIHAVTRLASWRAGQPNEHNRSLEAEIEQYRKLLEGEESRAGLRKVLQSKEIGDIIGGGGASSNVYTTTSLTKSSTGSMGGGGVSLLSATAQTLSSSATAATTTTTTTTTAKSTSVIKSQSERLSQESGELTSKIYYKGTAKGNVSIKEASIDGKYILLENTSLTADENIGKWQLVRKVDDKPEVTFAFPEEFILKAGRSIKVWAHCAEAVNDPPNQIIDYKTGSFQTGMNAKTQLINTKGEERAVHTQSTTQSTVIYA